MDVLHEQVARLSLKIDALHQTIEQLAEKNSQMLSEFKLNSDGESHRFSMDSNLGRHLHQTRSNYDGSMDHKDVLSDSGYPELDSQSGERVLSPEIQIQRLTAQLTAAYNRIAALEEQLLARRIHY
jgi:hypothetical protein